LSIGLDLEAIAFEPLHRQQLTFDDLVSDWCGGEPEDGDAAVAFPVGANAARDTLPGFSKTALTIGLCGLWMCAPQRYTTDECNKKQSQKTKRHTNLNQKTPVYQAVVQCKGLVGADA
jgi:hypothetical protein